jgi:hypothetical protein
VAGAIGAGRSGWAGAHGCPRRQQVCGPFPRLGFAARGRCGPSRETRQGSRRSADGRAVVTTPRSGRHCRWPTARTRRSSMTCQCCVEWPQCSRTRHNREDDMISGLAAGHSGHAHPPACVPPAPSAPPSQVPWRRRVLRAVYRSSPSRVPWCYPGYRGFQE